MSVPDITTLPYTTVQHDFPSVISDVRESVVASEDFWISCYREGSTSVHGKVNVSHDAGLVARDGVLFEREAGSSTSFTATCAALEISPTRVRIPRQTIQLDSAVTAFDVTPDGTRVATCTSTGALSVHASSAIQKTQLQKDASSTSLRFFPSTQVLLTTTTLFDLRVISAADADFGSTPRVLRGHRRTPTDCAFIDRGREVLSCGKDGTVRRWDVGKGEQVAMWTSTASAPIFRMAFDGDKSVYAALGDGCVEVLDISSPATASTTRSDPGPNPSALHAIALSHDRTLLASGSRNGVVRVYDLRSSLSLPLYAWKRNGACI
ncbi:WD40 repeat-like protein, partial [Exidia glandulosa HHB12029]